jgi:hypothetical protein
MDVSNFFLQKSNRQHGMFLPATDHDERPPAARLAARVPR